MKIQKPFWAKQKLLSRKTLNYDFYSEILNFLFDTNYASLEWPKIRWVSRYNISRKYKGRKCFQAVKIKKRKLNYTKSKLVELQTAGVNESKKKTAKNCKQQKNSKDWQLSKQIISRHFFCNGKFTAWKKLGLVQIRTQDFCCPQAYSLPLN